MKTVFLLRHAKSSWDNRQLRDAERPLNERGQRAARLMGMYFKQSGVTVDAVLLSPAVRTRETFELIQADCPINVTPIIDEKFYMARERVLLQHIQQLPEEADSVLVVNHNPTIHDLALSLVGDGKKEHVQRLREHFPTSGFAKITFDVSSWDKVKCFEGVLDDYAMPKSLV